MVDVEDEYFTHFSNMEKETSPNKNTALLRCSWAFEKQTKLKQTDYCQWVRPTDFVKRSKES